MECSFRDLAPLCLATALSCQAQDEQDVKLDLLLQRHLPECERYRDRLEKIFPGFPTDSGTLSHRLRENLGASGQILKLRYVPTIEPLDLGRFSSDFPAYLHDRFSSGRICMAGGDPRQVVDFVDAFVMDHPGYISGSTFPSYPNGKYDEARFSTISLWKNPESGRLLASTLLYERWIESRGLHTENISTLQGTYFLYDNSSDGKSYDFFLKNYPNCFGFQKQECQEPVLFARTSSEESYALSVGAEGVRSFLRARDECYGDYKTCLWDPD